MLFNLLFPLSQDVDAIDFFRLFGSYTVRAGGALLTALAIGLLIGPGVIRWLKSRQGAGQPIREIGPDHQGKRGTPTMGGLILLTALTFSSLLWMDLTVAWTWIVLGITVGFGAVGFYDDYRKLKDRSHKGSSAKLRLAIKSLLTIAAALWISQAAPPAVATGIAVPFFKDVLLDAGLIAFVIFAVLVVVGSANAVNLTDGLDGLASMLIVIAAAAFGIIAYVVGRPDFARDLLLINVPHAEELAVFCAALIGAGLSFLWYNAPPARVFMGDTGSLSLGGALGTVAVIVKHEFVLAIVGGLFVVEALSVVLQVGYFRHTKRRTGTGRRIFRMAPIHHHFEKMGLPETTVVIRFWIVGIVLALIGLATLKLR